MLFGLLKKCEPEDDAVLLLYPLIVEKARSPIFYQSLGVPDTVTGRFDMIVLHVVLLVNRLRGEGKTGAKLSQALFDRFFIDMDRALREKGVGDLSVPRHIKRMMQAFNGRREAYEQALASEDDDILRDAIRRNLYGTVENIPDDMVNHVVDYVKTCRKGLRRHSLNDFMAGRLLFAEVK
ncbi:MAG: ubiquinol-cytochrome C chaperone [Micavibrio aeruginosavorus]|uniref:Ubiquinol-cytochrome C chaperone n=1 Tax=Micavibrio aeruginosavorus TaxID=349221 RepID=A0A7T5R0G5_9BACT|nr:MAG: ubiquinol-cytochrome C chaperone [Micavibrio aeruginosavorus]